MKRKKRLLEQNLFDDPKVKKFFTPVKRYSFYPGDKILVKPANSRTLRAPRCFCYLSTTTRFTSVVHLFYHETVDYKETFTDVQLKDCLKKIIRANGH